jgi:hypothetical protein
MERSLSGTEISPPSKLVGGRDGGLYGELCPIGWFAPFQTKSADSTILSLAAPQGTCRYCMFMPERRRPIERFTGGS